MNIKTPLWYQLAWMDIAIRYRRSLIGPFWITLTMLVFVISVGYLYAGLFRQPVAGFLHFLSIGLVCWYFFSASIVESSDTYISGRDYLLNTTISPGDLLLRVVARNGIIMLHNWPVVLVTGLLSQGAAGWNIPVALVGLLLLIINVTWMSMIIALLSVRFRDVASMMSALLQLLFILSPIIWKPEILPERSVLVFGNPVYYLIEAVRSPLLADGPNWTAIGVSLVLAIAGTGLAAVAYNSLRPRIAFWAS